MSSSRGRRTTQLGAGLKARLLLPLGAVICASAVAAMAVSYIVAGAKPPAVLQDQASVAAMAPSADPFSVTELHPDRG